MSSSLGFEWNFLKKENIQASNGFLKSGHLWLNLARECVFIFPTLPYPLRLGNSLKQGF